MLQPVWIPDHAPADSFPHVSSALRDPNGLLAVGGDLRPERLLAAYARGIFPWYSRGQPILWWCPDPRAVLYPDRLHVSRSLRKRLRSGGYEVAWNRDFQAVLHGCAAPRQDQPGTWIVPAMFEAYVRLHALGHAHSVETRFDGALVGGLYGVAIGRVFFGESMFARRPDASKIALHALCQAGFALIDCQIESEHLGRLGAERVPREEFCALLDRHCPAPPVLVPSVPGTAPSRADGTADARPDRAPGAEPALARPAPARADGTADARPDRPLESEPVLARTSSAPAGSGSGPGPEAIAGGSPALCSSSSGALSAGRRGPQ